MSFRGLFIGIDRYESSDINWLACASRDAKALHTLFLDNFGGASILLVDSMATKSKIEEELINLQSAYEDDFVVIMFSGHGIPTHQLVAYDTNRLDLNSTTISLENLLTIINHIRAKHLLIILDCCFSGGMGAKVFQTETLPRNIDSINSILEQISGEGRLIITAATATQEAWEYQRYGHGFLTYFLLDALLGAEEVMDSERINIFLLLDFLVKQVEGATALIGKEQTPTVYGKVDGRFSLPVLRPSKLYFTAFPERAKEKVTTDITSLVSCGIPEQIIHAWSGSIDKLNNLQTDAINEFGILEGHHLVVSAPTSSGKTMIGELAALAKVVQRQRAFFLFPLKALVNDKHRHFQKIYEGYGIRTIRATGDSIDDIPALMRGQYDICLLTYEKFSALVLGNPFLLEQVGVVVIDEVQMIADKSRGLNLEFIITLLKMRRIEGIEPQVISLSAVIGDTNGLECWLGARLLRREDRPIILHEGIVNYSGCFKYISSDLQEEKIIQSYFKPEFRKNSSQDMIIPLVKKLVSEGKQVIVFRETKGEARSCGNYLANNLQLPAADETISLLPSGDPSLASESLRNCLKHGVAFHISDLDRDERVIIEEEFRKKDSKIRVIAATTTLAMGVNTPAEAVVIAGLTHPGDEPYSIAEYKNIVGRAGRLGFSTTGYSFLVGTSPKEGNDFWYKYVKGKPENLQSRFFDSDTDIRSLIVKVLVATQKNKVKGLSSNDIIAFLEESFGAYQKKRMTGKLPVEEKDITVALNNLCKHGLINYNTEKKYELTELGWLSGQGGVEVESIIRLIEALGTLTSSQINEPTLIAATQLTLELDNLNVPLNRKSNQKEPMEWANILRKQGVAPYVLAQLNRYLKENYTGTMRAKRAASCLLWISDYSMSKIEDILTQFGSRYDGAAGPIRSVAARTYDILPTTIRIAEILHPNLILGEKKNLLLTRLEVGIPSAIGEIAIYLGSNLSRSDYQSLLKNNVLNMEQLSKISDDLLLLFTGNNDAKYKTIKNALEKYPKDKLASAREIIDFPEFS